MSRLLGVFAAILLVSWAAEAVPDSAAQQTIDKICKQTEDYKFCDDVLVRNLETSSPSIKYLTNVTVEEADRFSANTLFFISRLLEEAGEERGALQMCADAYAKVNIAFSMAASSISQGQYRDISKLEEGVAEAVEICKTDFVVPSFDVNPLIERNRRMRILIAMAKAESLMVS